MTTRETFLACVRREMAKTPGLFVATPTPRPAEPAGQAAAIRQRASGEVEALFARFRAEAEAVAAVVHRAGTVGAAAELVLGLAAARGARQVATWRAAGLGPVTARLAEGGLEIVEGPVERLAASDVGLTTADAAVAETGSLVLASGPGRGRAISLLPACHVALFGPDALVGTLEEAGVLLEAWHAGGGEGTGANIVFITGPSRTADIELTITRGVHGPREVHAVLVDGL